MRIMNIDRYFNINIVRLAQGIQQAEGWYVPGDNPNYPNGTKSYIYHNPGNVFGSPYEKYNVNGYSYFEDDFIGMFSLCWQILRYAQGKISGVTPQTSIADALSVYTGLSDPVTLSNYVSVVEKVSGIQRSKLISDLIL